MKKSGTLDSNDTGLHRGQSSFDYGSSLGIKNKESDGTKDNLWQTILNDVA